MIVPEITISLSFDKKVKKSELRQITTSESAVGVFREIFDKDTFDWTEEMILLCLNHSNKVLGFYKVSKGGTAQTVCDPKIIFTVALNCGASKIIISHNHPSGSLIPSKADEIITEKIKEAGKLLDIELLDHIILIDEAHYSFRDDGNL